MSAIHTHQVLDMVGSIEDLQMSLLNNIEDVIYVATPDKYELVYVNEAFKNIWGHNVVGKKCYKVLQNRDEPCTYCTNHIIFDSNHCGVHVWEHQNEITQRWFKCTDKVITLKNGDKVRFELASEITQLKATELQLKKSKEEYHMLFHAMSDGFSYHEVVYDKKNEPIDYIFRAVNPKFEKFTGLKKEDIINKRASECIPKYGDRVPTFIEKYGLIGRDGGETNFEFYFKPYKTWFNVSVFRPQQDFFCLLLDDITEKKTAEKKIIQTLADLKVSNQELEQFAYVASHDLQEPLRMVSSFTNLLQKKYNDVIDDKGKMYINYAVDGALRMQSLINDLLDFSRVSTRGKEFQECDCNLILGKAIANLKHSIEENTAIITNDELPLIKGDEIQLMRVFQNLISNGIKFKGNIPPAIHIGCQRKDKFYEFSISDNGIGINPKFKEKIFIIFQRLNTREEYPGTGIGLAICKRIINRHKGKIWVESELEQGSTFYFTLPVLKKEN
ncbi:PAS domain-containing protein [Prolixibacteraceae bacterium JC049]|nr:PAS domain-containing protein [Prolixibacteraceae bacterium JC049]